MKLPGGIRDCFAVDEPPRGESPRGPAGALRYVFQVIRRRPPWLVRVIRLQPLFALASGLLCIFLFRRGFEYLPVVISLLVFILIYIGLRQYPRFGNRASIVSSVSDLALLIALNDMIIFVLPFYFESMSVPSRQLLFGLLIAGLTLTAGWYRLYERLVLPSKTAGAAFFFLAFFCVLNFVFPIVFSMRNVYSCALSGLVACIMALLFVFPVMPGTRSYRKMAAFLAGLAVCAVLLWFGRSIIPPAPLRLLHATACEDVSGYRPVNPFTVSENGGPPEVYFHTAIFAPRGLRERIDHAWRHEGRSLFTVHLSEIHGGKRAGFSTWSRHRLLEGRGRYTVEVWTAGGQLLGQGTFVIK